MAASFTLSVRGVFMILRGRFIRVLATGSAISMTTMLPVRSFGQDAAGEVRPSAAVPVDDVKALGQLVRQLQVQLQSLHARVETLEVQERAAREESRTLRAQLAAGKVSRIDSEPEGGSGTPEYSTSASTFPAAARLVAVEAVPQAADERIQQLEESVEL